MWAQGNVRCHRKRALCSRAYEAPEIIAVDIYGAGLSSQREASARGAQRSPGGHNMADLVLIVRVALALVFTVAAAGKLTTRAGSRLLVESFDLDRRLAPAAVALPWTELGLAAALLVPATARWAAAASWALLAVFSSLLLRNRRNGNAGGCNCFGAFGRTTLGRWPLVRNGLLLLLASLVAAGGVQLPVSAIWRGLW